MNHVVKITADQDLEPIDPFACDTPEPMSAEDFLIRHNTMVQLCAARNLIAATDSAQLIAQETGSHIDEVSAFVSQRDALTEEDRVKVFGPARAPKPKRSRRGSRDIFGARLSARRWCFPNMSEAGKVALFISPPKMAKSALQIALAVSKATGKDFLDLGTSSHPLKPGTVWFYGLEDMFEDHAKRIIAISQANGLTEADFYAPDGSDRLYVDSGIEDPLKLFSRDGSSPEPIFEELEWMRQEIVDRGVELLILDPFVKILSGLPENDNSIVDSVMSTLVQELASTGVTIHIVHHTRKINENGRVDANAARGGSAIIGAARSVWLQNSLTSSIADRMEKDAKAYFELSDGGSNNSPWDAKPMFFEKAGEFIEVVNEFGEVEEESVVAVKRAIPAAPGDVFREGASMILTTMVSDLISEALDESDRPDLSKLPLMVAANSRQWIGKLIAESCMPDNFTQTKIGTPVAEALIEKAALMQVEAKTSNHVWKRIWIHSAAQHDEWFKRAQNDWIRHPKG